MQRRQYHYQRTTAAVAWLLVLSIAAAGATTSTTESLEVELEPASKWSRCIADGRLNIRWRVQGSGKLHSGLQLPENTERCKPSKPSACKWVASCDASKDCSKFFPGELSGREKCLVVLNSGSESRTATIQLSLEPAGNWGAITFGVVVSSLGLLAVIAAGCYTDLKKLAGGKKKAVAAASKR